MEAVSISFSVLALFSIICRRLVAIGVTERAGDRGTQR